MTSPTHPERSCSVEGHDVVVLVDGSGDPTLLECLRCSARWTVDVDVPVEGGAR